MYGKIKLYLTCYVQIIPYFSGWKGQRMPNLVSALYQYCFPMGQAINLSNLRNLLSVGCPRNLRKEYGQWIGKSWSWKDRSICALPSNWGSSEKTYIFLDLGYGEQEIGRLERKVYLKSRKGNLIERSSSSSTVICNVNFITLVFVRPWWKSSDPK